VSPRGREGQGVRYLVALRQHWRLIALLVTAAVLAALVYSALAEDRYDAQADILVTPVAADDTTFAGIPVLRETGLSRAVLTVARLIKSPAVADAAKASLKTDESRDALLDSIEVAPQAQSTIVTITASASDPNEAARIANAFANAFVAERTRVFQERVAAATARLKAQLAAAGTGADAAALRDRLDVLSSLAGAEDPTVQVASPAAVPIARSWPRPALSVVVAAIAALLLGTGLAVALELVSPRIRREDELVLEQRLPILARVPRMGKKAVRDYFLGREPLPADVSEAYRTLRTTLARSGRRGRFPQSVLVTSAAPSEGRTMTAVNLAVTVASTGQRVILVDGDLRRPMVGTMLDVSPAEGRARRPAARTGEARGGARAPALAAGVAARGAGRRGPPVRR
jgi:capsular polysaccharide biosynthesis protein